MSSTKENEKRPQTPPLATLRMPPMMRWFLVALAVLIAIEFVYHWSTQGQSIPYSTFKQFVIEGKIAKVEIDGQSLTATARGIESKDASKSGTYTVTIPSSVPTTR